MAKIWMYVCLRLDNGRVEYVILFKYQVSWGGGSSVVIWVKDFYTSYNFYITWSWRNELEKNYIFTVFWGLFLFCFGKCDICNSFSTLTRMRLSFHRIARAQELLWKRLLQFSHAKCQMKAILRCERNCFSSSVSLGVQLTVSSDFSSLFVCNTKQYIFFVISSIDLFVLNLFDS